MSFWPTWKVSSIFTVTPAQLLARGKKYVLTDLDNTLIPWNQKDALDQVRDWAANLHQHGIEVIVVSNNNHARVAEALADLPIQFIARALKPLPVGIKRALAKFNIPAEQAVMVGDQFFTDMLAGTFAGVDTLIVSPLVHTDGWNTKINRLLEKPVRHFIRQREWTKPWAKERGHAKFK
ncbi:YqeG family HAD IIIA-type phosphatase [Schleiferilactobacillus perolens]|jgi:HAD superfamily phosphatase (TIGR01668 family)|uniref:YqeG family HAD IIIA-type phosphatase n=1 Tax=Schleiferilactobacillus perolens TaxID=100468 RepID=UPI0023562D91|nr:YqeG family HAD IIIA-type phosphatase [Schleiferilactobacillus perolens]MCI1892525.1 YqeG family HAD IIIA-type phosphatase [Schleiferilactobacillus harbinensis]MCI1913574.1 YqeG family HAD IIIA-type phosphatase [Schleiferilactobacillus harbinensis]MCI2171843.1 YqeG family HAD IIIA-type phosphatase [Schleiferilactobacillus perolens]